MNLPPIAAGAATKRLSLLAIATLAGGSLLAAVLLLLPTAQDPARPLPEVPEPTVPADASRPVTVAAAKPERAALPAGDLAFAEEETSAPARASRARREHARLVAEARAAPREFAVRGAQILASDQADTVKVAVLRAAWEARVDGVGALFAQAAALPDVATPRADSVPSFAVHLLGKHAFADAGARVALEEIAFGAGAGAAARPVRMRAAAAFAGTARDAELQRLLAHVFRCDAPELRQTVSSALQQNPHPGATGVLDVLDPGGARTPPEIER